LTEVICTLVELKLLLRQWCSMT